MSTQANGTSRSTRNKSLIVKLKLPADVAAAAAAADAAPARPKPAPASRTSAKKRGSAAAAAAAASADPDTATADPDAADDVDADGTAALATTTKDAKGRSRDKRSHHARAKAAVDDSAPTTPARETGAIEEASDAAAAAPSPETGNPLKRKATSSEGPAPEEKGDRQEREKDGEEKRSEGDEKKGEDEEKKDKADDAANSKSKPKAGPKRRKGPDGEMIPAHKLGPKANQGAINAQLRALDRTGKASRRWQRAPFSFTTFTGHRWELAQWNTPKLPDEGGGDVQSEATGSSENKGEHASSRNDTPKIILNLTGSLAAAGAAPLAVSTAPSSVIT